MLPVKSLLESDVGMLQGGMTMGWECECEYLMRKDVGAEKMSEVTCPTGWWDV